MQDGVPVLSSTVTCTDVIAESPPPVNGLPSGLTSSTGMLNGPGFFFFPGFWTMRVWDGYATVTHPP